MFLYRKNTAPVHIWTATAFTTIISACLPVPVPEARGWVQPQSQAQYPKKGTSTHKFVLRWLLRQGLDVKGTAHWVVEAASVNQKCSKYATLNQLTNIISCKSN